MYFTDNYCNIEKNQNWFKFSSTSEHIHQEDLKETRKEEQNKSKANKIKETTEILAELNETKNRITREKTTEPKVGYSKRYFLNDKLLAGT